MSSNATRDTKFKKGQSRNAPGRRVGSKNRKQIVERVLSEVHAHMEGGRKIKHTTIEHVLIALRNKALLGNLSAMQLLEDLELKYGPQERPVGSGVIVIPTRTADEVRAEMARLRLESMKPVDCDEVVRSLHPDYEMPKSPKPADEASKPRKAAKESLVPKLREHLYEEPPELSERTKEILRRLEKKK